MNATASSTSSIGSQRPPQQRQEEQTLTRSPQSGRSDIIDASSDDGERGNHNGASPFAMIAAASLLEEETRRSTVSSDIMANNSSDSMVNGADGGSPESIDDPQSRQVADSTAQEQSSTNNIQIPGTHASFLNNGSTVRLRVPPGAHIRLVPALDGSGARQIVVPNMGSNRRSPSPPLPSSQRRRIQIHRSSSARGYGRRGTDASENRAIREQSGRLRRRVVQTTASPHPNSNNANNQHISFPPNARVGGFIASPIMPNIPPVQVNPLEPSVLSDQRQDLVDAAEATDMDGSESSNDPSKLDDCKCVLCLEYMTDPQRHDGCESRFCTLCIEKLKLHSSGPLRCPTCRNSIDEFQTDHELASQIAQIPKIRCRFEGCKKMLLLGEVAKHEVTCQFVKVACRYSTFGCCWIGTRKDLSLHEREECSFAQVSGLVEQHMHLKANFNHVTGHLHARLQGTYQLTQVLQQQVQTLSQQSRQQHATASPSNPLHVLEYVMALLSNTLPYSPHRWKNMQTREAKASIFNQLVFFPTLLLSVIFCCEMITGLKHPNVQHLDIVDIAANIFIAFLGLAIVGFMAYLDRYSSIQWKSFQLPNRLGKHRFGLIISVFCTTILYGLFFLNLRLSVGPGYCIAVFTILVVNSLFLPIVFSTMALPRIASFSAARLSHDAFLQSVFPGRFAKTIMLGLAGGFVWGAIDTPVPDIQLTVVTSLPLLTFLSIPRQFKWAIGSAIFTSMATLSLESLVHSLLSGAFAIACQAIPAVVVVLLMRFKHRPRSELLLFGGVFGLALLCALV